MIVFKTLADPTVAKAAAEKIKTRIFRRYGFFEPPSDQSRQIAFEKSYEPYFVVEGKYSIDYYQGCIYTITTHNENALEVFLLDHKLKPRPAKKYGQHKTIRLEGEERILHEKKGYLVMDAKGREASPERIPSAPQEKQPKKIITEYKNNGKSDFGPRWEVEVLRSRIAVRPPRIKRIVNELFKVSKRTLFFIPTYKVWFKNTKTGEEKIAKFDGVSGRSIP